MRLHDLSDFEERLRQDDEGNLTRNEAFLLSDAETRRRYVEAYATTRALYFRDQVSFDAILERIALFAPEVRDDIGKSFGSTQVTHGATSPVRIDGRATHLICKWSDSHPGIYPAYFRYPDMRDNIFGSIR